MSTTVLSGLGVWLFATTIWPVDGVGPEQDHVVVSRGADNLVATRLEVSELYQNSPFDQPRYLMAPEGVGIKVFAAGLGPVRFMAWHPDGALLVTVPRTGEVLALVDRDRDGEVEQVIPFVEGLDRPHGIAVRGRDVLVAEHARLVSLPDEDGDLKADRVDVLSEDIPSGGGHWTRSLVIGPDGSLFVAAGSSCNACVEEDARRATVMKLSPPGGAVEIYARGLRNSVGLAIHPDTGELWASDNGRDMLGDDLPPEEINRIVSGGDYGWPYCYGDRVPDPDLGSAERCKMTQSPVITMQAHSAPLGITFGEGLDAPEPYSTMLYVAFHGSWNRRVPTGYKLVGIPFHGGEPDGEVTDIVTGWLVGREAWGRPVAPLVGPDGALYLSDDRAGAVYLITWSKQTVH